MTPQGSTMDDGSGTARCRDDGQRPVARRTTKSDGRYSGRRARAKAVRTGRRRRAREKRREGFLLQRCVKEKGNKNTARARSAPTYTDSRRPARRLSPNGTPENHPDSPSRPPFLLTPTAPCAISRAEFSPSPRARNLPFDPSSFRPAESGSRPYLSRAAAPRCCVRPTLSAVEWPIITPP